MMLTLTLRRDNTCARVCVCAFASLSIYLSIHPHVMDEVIPTKPKVTREYNFSFWFLHVGNAVLVTLTSLLYFNALAYHFEFTYLTPATAPGHLHENRYENAIFWLLWITSIFRILAIVTTTMRGFVPNNRTIYTFHLIIIILALASEIVSLVYHGVTLNSANNSPNESPTGANNVCNDYRWCCVYHTNPNSGCPVLLAPCAPFVNTTDLKTNFECVISTGAAVVLIIVYLFILLVSYGMGRGKDIYVETYVYDQNAPFYVGSSVANPVSKVSSEIPMVEPKKPHTFTFNKPSRHVKSR